ncbi:MAG TPA: helix-turn-helix domain-containing protein, partial [Agromyces sp.]
MTTEPDPDGIRDIVEVDVLKAFTHPLRNRLYDLLAIDGPATVSMLAEKAGVAIGSVSHHLGILARA